MRTTIRLDDTLLREAKLRAAEQGITLTRLIDESLRERLSRRSGGVGERAPDLPTYGRGGVLAGIDLRDNRALRDLMDEEAPSGGASGPARRRLP